MHFTRILLAALIASTAAIIGFPMQAGAQTDDCSKRNPPFPDYNSGEVLVNVPTDDPDDIGIVPIRRGFYCVPNSAMGNEALEAAQGFGFGYDKARNRHNITKFSAIGFILQSPYNFETTSDLGPGWNFVAYAREKEREPDGEWIILQEQKVIAATSEANRDEYYDMPAGNPVGLITAYCDFGNPAKLRCQDWVTKGLSNGEGN